VELVGWFKRDQGPEVPKRGGILRKKMYFLKLIICAVVEKKRAF